MQVHHLVVLDSQVVSSALQMCNLYDSSGLIIIIIYRRFSQSFLPSTY